MKTTMFRLRADVIRLLAEAWKMRLLREEEAKAEEWRAGFEAMGRDPDTNNVEYAISAAREVIFGY